MSDWRAKWEDEQNLRNYEYAVRRDNERDAKREAKPKSRKAKKRKSKDR